MTMIRGEENTPKLAAHHAYISYSRVTEQAIHRILATDGGATGSFRFGVSKADNLTPYVSNNPACMAKLLFAQPTSRPYCYLSSIKLCFNLIRLTC